MAKHDNVNVYPYFDEVLDPRTVRAITKYLKARIDYTRLGKSKSAREDYGWYDGLLQSLRNVTEDLEETLWFQEDLSDVKFEYGTPTDPLGAGVYDPAATAAPVVPTVKQTKEDHILALLDAIFGDEVDDEHMFIIEL